MMKSKDDLSGVAGWLYADALMALAVLFLVTSGTNGRASNRVIPTATSTPVPTTSFVADKTLIQTGIEKDPKIVTIKTNYELLLSGSTSEINRLKSLTNDLLTNQVGTRKIGMVLNFGVHRRVGKGQEIADMFNQRVLSDLGFGLDSAGLRNFDLRGQGAKREGEVVLELYLIGG